MSQGILLHAKKQLILEKYYFIRRRRLQIADNFQLSPVGSSGDNDFLAGRVVFLTLHTGFNGIFEWGDFLVPGGVVLTSDFGTLSKEPQYSYALCRLARNMCRTSGSALMLRYVKCLW